MRFCEHTPSFRKRSGDRAHRRPISQIGADTRSTKASGVKTIYEGSEIVGQLWAEEVLKDTTYGGEPSAPTMGTTRPSGMEWQVFSSPLWNCLGHWWHMARPTRTRSGWSSARTHRT